MDLILMGNRDARRLGLIHAALQGKITNGEGAAALGLRVRQFTRLRRRVRQHGARGEGRSTAPRAAGPGLDSTVLTLAGYGRALVAGGGFRVVAG